MVACIVITTKVDKDNLEVWQKCALFILHCKNSWIFLTENKIFVKVLRLSPRGKVSLSIRWIQECLRISEC